MKHRRFPLIGVAEACEDLLINIHRECEETQPVKDVNKGNGNWLKEDIHIYTVYICA